MYPAYLWDISIPGHNGLRARCGLTNGPALEGCIFEPDLDHASIDCLPSLLLLADFLTPCRSGGDRRRNSIILLAHENCPADPYDLVCERDDGDIFMGALLQR
jgi:hypothetical protein